MGRYLARRFLLSGVAWFLLVTCGFFLVRLLPGNPFHQDETLDPILQQVLVEQTKLDSALITQYLDYMLNLFKGNLGFSISGSQKSVIELVVEAFRFTLILSGLTLLVTVLSSLVLASVVTVNLKAGVLFGHISKIVFCLPVLVSAPLLIGVFSLALGWLPISAATSWAGWILPVVAISLKPSFKLAVVLQTEIERSLQQNYSRTHKAVGFSWYRITSFWSLREGLVAYFSYLGVVIMDLLAGSLLTEVIFGIPGMGFRLSESIGQRDYLTITGLIVWIGTLVIIVQLFIDLLIGVADPRVRLTGEKL